MATFYDQVHSNKRKSVIVVIGFVAFVTVSAYLVAYALNSDPYIAILAFAFSAIGSIGSYYFSDKIILSLSGARQAKREEFFDFYTVAQNLSLSQQLPMPKLYVINDTAMNAFATGRNPQHAVVCATTGILNRLNRTELEGVIAHELSHIKNYDMLLMSIVTVLVGSLTLLADWLIRASWFGGRDRDSDNRSSNQFQVVLIAAGFILAFLGPIIAQLIQLAISRRREFLADASAAAMTKYPEGLARALEKLGADHEPLEAANKATAHLYITNPLKNRHDSIGWFASLFNTHPPLSQRIAALRSL